MMQSEYLCHYCTVPYYHFIPDFLEIASSSAKLKRSLDFGSKEVGDLRSTPLERSI